MKLALLCSAYTNKLITAKDHAAVQINIGHLNENGQYVDGNFTTFALAGNVRAMVRGLCCLVVNLFHTFASVYAH